MKRNKIYSIKHKLLTFVVLLLASAQMAMAQTGNWTDYRATSYDSGSGTKTSPYIIKTAAQLAYFQYRVTNGNDRSVYVELGDNIDLAAHWWVPIGKIGNWANGFMGHFDGKGYTISNMNCEGSRENAGLFSIVNGGTIQNLAIDNAYITNTSNSVVFRRVGVLMAGCCNSPVIENIIIRNSKIDVQKQCSMNSIWVAIGGLAGPVKDTPTFRNCYVDVDIDMRNVTSYDTNALKWVWYGKVIGSIEGGNQANMKNIYANGHLRLDTDRNIQYAATIVGYNLTSNGDNLFTDNVFYNEAPTVGASTTPLTAAHKQGTQKAFGADFIHLVNEYANGQGDLNSWKLTNGVPQFSGVIVTDLKEEYIPKETKTSYVFSSTEPATNITWKVDGKTVSADADNSYRLTIDLSNKIRQGEVSAVINGETVTRTFEIFPKYYSVDLYATNYAGGTGTKDDPYQISNDLELAKLAYDVNNGSTGAKFSGTYFVLTKDIELTHALWMPIGTYNYKNWKYFAGKFNGNGHVIKDMHIFIDDQDNDWSNWGLFATLQGLSANDEAITSVSNFIIDGARLEKRPGVTPVAQGLNAGLLVGEYCTYSELSNIIVKNSVITDNNEAYTTSIENCFGGFIGNIKQSTGGVFKIFNLTSDVDIQLFKNATVTANKIFVAGIFARANFNGMNTVSSVYPTNLYVHGKTIDTKNGCYVGTICAQFLGNTYPSANQSATWYYVNAQTGSNVRNDGSQKTLASFATDFVKQTNGYIQNNSLNDLSQWVYTETDGFNFGNTTLELAQTDVNTITATTPDKDGTELYAWYVSQDRQNWTEQKDAAGNTLYSHTLTLPYAQYDRYVYAVLQDGSSSSKTIKVPGLRFTATLNENNGTYSINVTNTIWNTDNSKFKISYNWKKNDESVGTGASYTPGSLSDNDVVSCEVIVTDEQGNELYHQTVYKATIVYLCPAGVTVDGTTYAAGQDKFDDSDPEWGYSPEKPMLTWKGAYQKLTEAASWTENVIVLMGTSNPQVTENGYGGGKNSNQNSLTEYNWKTVIEEDIITRKTTITGQWNGIDYQGTIEVYGDANGINLYGDTRFENITFNRNSMVPNGSGGTKENTNDYDIFFCQYNSLEMGKGIRMTNYISSPNYGTIDGASTASFQIFGGFNNDNRYKQNTAANMKAMEDALIKYGHGKEGFSITIKSGHYSVICAGGRQSQNAINGMMGTPNVPIKCTITMDIDRSFNDEEENNKIYYQADRYFGANNKKDYSTIVNTDYDAGLILAGNHEGAMYGDVDIIIKSGKVARVVNGTLGNSRNIDFGNGITFPDNTYMGRAYILLDPASSEENKTENINSRVIITELYGGSTGRSFDGGGSNIDNPFYGYSTITINGGTFKILPEDNTATDKIICGIYGAGAGGRNGIGNDQHHTSDTRIPYWNSTKDLALFGNYATAKNNLVTYKCYNTDTHDYTYVDPRKTNTKIIINGGVFGSATIPIDGIYACGSGYMSPGLWSKGSMKPDVDGGNVYGQEGETVASLTINGGTFYCKNGIFAGGRGTNYYYSTNPYGGTDANYTDLGKTYGNVEMNIEGGEFHCPIFGGGYGVADAKLKSNTNTITTLSNMARLYGKSTVNIYGGTFYDNIYGGGDMAMVEYNGVEPATNVNIYNSADIRGSVFGGGNGRLLRKTTDDVSTGTLHPELVGKVIGSTNVTTIGDINNAPYIYGDIYGGGNLAQVGRNTYVYLYAGHFAGQIFGGGKGSLWDDSDSKVNTPDDTDNIRNSADIAGNTNVTLAQEQGNQEEGEDGQRVDNFSINVIWNKLWKAEENKFYVWDADMIGRSGEETVNKDLFYKDGKFLNPHNIYGGGNFACKVGTYNADGTVADSTGLTIVTVKKGMTPFELLKTTEWKESYNDNNNPHFYVFGGGYGAHTTVGSTNVTVNVEGDYGIYNAEAGDDDEQLAKPHRTSKSARSTDTQSTKTEMPVFDNSKGIPNFTVLGVLGGGYSGLVTGNTKVTVDGKTFLHRIYGGGFGEPKSTANNTTGQIGGNTEVYVQGAHTYGDIFGGGAGVAPKTANGSTTTFVDVARVIGTTKVEISDDALIYGNVYGGGDIANVGEYIEDRPASHYADKPLSVSTLNQEHYGELVKYDASHYSSFVNILGGDTYGEVYGGGKGLKKSDTPEYKRVGRINGNTIVHIANSDTKNQVNTQSQNGGFSENSTDSKGNTVPYIWNRIYGGCAYGTVDGNTLVHVEGGMLGLNVFGGGYGSVKIDNDQTNPGSGTSTDLSTLSQVLGRKDTANEGTYANVLGNTKVQIDGGSWIWNRRADINGNITTWTSVDADKNKICDNLDEFKAIVAAIKAAKSIDDIQNVKAKEAIRRILYEEDTKEFFTVDQSEDKPLCLFRKNNNIFGGGNRACFVGTYEKANGTAINADGTPMTGTGDAIVEINHSPVADIEDTKGNTISLLDCTTLQGLCWYLCVNTVAHAQFSVFGAGYGANTKVGNTYVYARPGVLSTADGRTAIRIDGKQFRYLNQHDDMIAYNKVEVGYHNDYEKVSSEDKRRYYGGSNGNDEDPQTYSRYRASRLAWSLGVPAFTLLEVHGGGFSGYVTGNTYVESDCQLHARNIYGAGLGATPYGTISADKVADYDFGSINGDAKVFMKTGNVSNNVYGGGAGVESIRVANGKEIDFNQTAGQIIDFPEMARVKGKTQVHIYGEQINNGGMLIDRTLIFGSVYGGGDVANVGTTKAEAQQFGHEIYTEPIDRASTVNIRGGAFFSQVFAGGNGRNKNQCADYTKLGGIYGNACVIVDRPNMKYPYCDLTTGETIDPAGDNMKHPAAGVNDDIKPYLLNRVFGGCQNGTVFGNTIVAINDGNIGHNVFGGGWGNVAQTAKSEDTNGDTDAAAAVNADVTSADVTGNTHVLLIGGQIRLTSMWLPETRFWEPSDFIGGKTYSPQYDHNTLKFKINHNIYAGGNEACVIGEKETNNGQTTLKGGNTYLIMTKGLLYNNTQVVPGQAVTNLFEQDEWREVYNKVGSPHFCVFGAGYGENTNVLGDTHVYVQMQGRGSIDSTNVVVGQEYKHFLSGYSVMDIIGGGYSGKVEGETHIIGDGGVFCRRVFGGSLYAAVKATRIVIKAIDCHDVFGGGLMGDILHTTNIQIGTTTSNDSNSEETAPSTVFTNKDIYIHGDVYGGNDVSGYVNVGIDKNGYFVDNGGKGTNINIYGGQIDGNVYGAGNGDYLYALDKAGHTQVTVNEYYPLNPNDPESEKVDLVYTVPMRENMPSYKAASDAAKIVNINSWRPMTNKVNISIQGESASDDKRVIIKGDVYGGGNSATVQKVQQTGVRASNTVGDIKINIGSHVKIGRVFMGCNGDALFTASEDNDFMNKFQRLNGDLEDYSKELNLADSIDWMGDPSNKGISTLWLPTRNENRPLVYPHLLDLYFQPVETDIQGTLLWDDKEDGTTLTDCEIGTFCCGGNRGNMNVYPKTEDDFPITTPKDDKKVGNVFEYIFPAGLTITDKIVGGCNNANYDYKGRVSHTGGYLLGEIHSVYPFIKLNIRNKFQPTESENAYKGGNVYGGCYKSGTIRGDVSIVLESDMLEGKSKEKLENSNELLGSNAEYSALNVFGAGYGMESYVYGNCYVKMGRGIECDAPSTSSNGTFVATGTSANFVYGGGQQGNVIGKTDVKVLNGHVFKSVTGGSYSGYVWGSTQIRVGFPKYYTVKPGFGGQFHLKRTDQNNKDIDQGKKVASETIKQTVRLIADDVVTQAVVDAVDGRYDFVNGTYTPINADNKSTYFTEVPAATPSVGWDKVNIVIGEAVYGGGYSLAQGGSVLANNTTVLKYDDNNNLDDGFDTSSENEIMKRNLGGTTAGFGGNTTIVIGDNTKGDRDHITISRQDMKVANVAAGQDLLGYYYKDEGTKDAEGNVIAEGTYHYIYQAGTYYKGGSKDAGTLPPDMEGENVYEYDNEGGVFGDGHLSYAEGFRSADLTGYGFAKSTISKPKILNTFQRMDVLRLTDNCFSLLGARDYATNAMDKTPYSISRVNEIQMFAQDVVTPADTLQADNMIRARNYMGFANNIHYVGALYSNVAFTDPWHDGNGKPGTYKTSGSATEATNYMEVKQKYIDDYYGAEGSDATLKQVDYVFEERNDGTAKNMIGIASGYALKVQNAQELEDNNGNIEENLYYGPVYGVIEMNLIDVREDEGGGYVYADNVHKRSSADDADSTESGSTGASHAVDFLETTGNFVFPYTPTEGRYIVDDCFPLGYDVHPNNPDEAIEAHYWYVTGFNYHYTAHITGYTFNSSANAPKNFDSNNLDGIVALSGLKPSQEVKIASWKLYSEHTAVDESTPYECDLEERNFDKDALDKDNKEHVMGGYTLHVGAGNSTEYVAPSKEGDGFAAELSLKKEATENDCKILENGNKIPAKDPDGVSRGDAKIVFRLEDKVNNTTTDYYNKHLSQPCKATLVLYAPAWEKEDGTPMTAKIALSKLYTRTGTGTNADPYKYTKVDNGTLDANATYYYKNGDANFYQELSKDKFYTRTEQGSEVTWTSVAQGSVKLGDPDAVYYYELNRHYTYTIDLTIDYVQGPDIEGNITIENCALPGERIRLRKDKVVVKADQAFSVTGYYWRIGKRKKVGDDWIFNDNSEWKKNDKNGEKGYDTFNQSDSKTATGMFQDSYYDKTEDFLEVPAYYYMNGYGIQLGITMNVPGLTDIIPVPMDETNHLTIHNYHRMDPHRENINLHIEDAVKRVADEENDITIADSDKLPEPRIYLADQSDLTAFIKHLGTIGQEQTDENGVTKAADERIQYGKHTQFILQNDLNVVTPSYDGSALADFRGTLHGNGHVVTGLEAGHCLVNQMTGNVYNFGLASGKITNMSATSGKIANYHCCFEYAPDANTTEGRTPVVYRMDGTIDKTYTTQDFRLGRVAYDLNEYYLRARYSYGTDADKQALQYIYDYYANGDYQYAHRTDAITGKHTGITYLRTGKDSDLPNYEQAETRHDRTHAIDKARAQNYVAAHKDATTGEDVAESRTGDYLPLFNASSIDANVVSTAKMNDFLFWGQSLQSTPADYPAEITSRQIGYMTNGVYRTAAYYGDNKMDAFYYNAYNSNNSNMSTYVHIPTTTAIDFTCQNDLPKAIGTATGANVVSRGIYYPPMADNAETFYDFLEKNGVTQNLLVYTADNDENNANEAYDIVSKALSYGETTRESLIKGHHIVADRTIQGTSDGTKNFTTSLLHLVERTPEGENSEGERCDNNDFCAPITFTVNNHAWYVRKPLYYANDNTGAWEGICLPFTVQKAEASLNGEITHFYGTPSADEKNDPTQNIHSLHHEYWLRGIMSVENASTGSAKEAKFQRPGNVGSKFFAPTGADGNAMNETMDYTFNNTFFIDTYENRLYNKEANPYYGESHRYADYQPLTAGIPYIVRFPGERYYEFDLSSAFYNNLLNKSAAAQTVTFNAYGPQNETAATYSIINIPVTNEMKTAVNDGFAHEGTFAATEVAQGNIYGMNDKGTAFDDASTFATVMPFRTYMIKGGASAKAAQAKSASQTASYSSEIRIAETTGIDNIESEVDRGNGEENENGEYLIVRPIGGNRVRIESTYATNLNVFSTTGQLYRILEVRPGTATYSGFYPGIYIFGKTKVLVK